MTLGVFLGPDDGERRKGGIYNIIYLIVCCLVGGCCL